LKDTTPLTMADVLMTREMNYANAIGEIRSVTYNFRKWGLTPGQALLQIRTALAELDVRLEQEKTRHNNLQI